MEVFEATYCALVRPTAEYESTVWDPYLTADDNRLELVQRLGARFVYRSN